MILGLSAMAALGVSALAITLGSPSKGRVALMALCAAGMILLSEFWPLTGKRVIGEEASAPPDINNTFAAVWLLAVVPLVQRPQNGPPGLSLFVDLLIAAAFLGFAMDMADHLVCLSPTGADAQSSAGAVLGRSDVVRVLLVLSTAFLAGAVLRGWSAWARFPWEYAPMFTALLLLLAPTYPLLQGLQLDRWYGIPALAVWLAALALLYGARQGPVTIALIGSLAALVLPLSLSILAWTPAP